MVRLHADDEGRIRLRAQRFTFLSKAAVIAFAGGVGLFFSACGLSSSPERLAVENSSTDAIMEQMKWKLGDTDWTFGSSLPLDPVLAASPEELERLLRKEERSGNGSDTQRTKLHRTTEALILKGDEASKKRAFEILTKLVEIHDHGDINAVVTTHGIEYPGVSQRQESGGKVYEITPPNPQRPSVLNVRDLAYEYAALYLLTGKPEYAAKSRDILLRFAEVAGSWPLYDRDNKPHSQDDKKYLAKSVANGLWAVWNPLDMLESRSLLRAYDIIRPTLTPEENTTITEKFFVHQKELIDRCEMTWLYHNLAGYRLPPLILFGRVLERPDYLHEATDYMKALLRYSYTADGFWKEITPGYHNQITARLMGSAPRDAMGYSDPPGYIYAKDGKRFDQLDLNETFKVQFSQIKKGLNVLAMPDGTYVSLNDSWPKKDRVDDAVDKSMLDQPGLLGVGGVAKLGAKGMVAFLQFGGRRGHDQDSALNLVWFAGGREVFSETGYQALPGSGSSRDWNTMAASHNTVTVNESMSFLDPARMPDWLTVPEGEGKTLTQAQPAAATVANQGRLLVWNPASDTAQAMEAERELAYPGVTSMFRRTIVMLPEGNGDGILVDIFRIRGGRTHDFALRGGLDAPYTMKFNVPLQPAKGTLYKFVQLRESAEIRPPLLATVQYADGYQVRSELSDVAGTKDASLQLLVGDGPAIRRLGTAPFSFVRHQLTEAQGKLETCYAWLHEAGREAKIRSVRTETKDGNVVMVFEREGRTDWIFSGQDDESRFDFEGWTFTGRLAQASSASTGLSGLVFSGNEIEKDGVRVAAASPFLSGAVTDATRRDAGDVSDSLLVKLDENSSLEGLQPRLVHVDFGKFIRFSIPVNKTTREGDFVRLELAHSPGFALKDGKVIMTNAPGWAYAGTPTVRVDCETVSP